MQAAGIDAFGSELRMLELAAPPSPAPDEVVISVRAAGVVNCTAEEPPPGWLQTPAHSSGRRPEVGVLMDRRLGLLLALPTDAVVPVLNEPGSPEGSGELVGCAGERASGLVDAFPNVLLRDVNRISAPFRQQGVKRIVWPPALGETELSL